MGTEAQGPKAPKQYDVFKTGQGKFVLVVGVEDGNVNVTQANHIADFLDKSPKELLAKAVTVQKDVVEHHLTEDPETHRVKWTFEKNMKGKLFE